MRLEQRLRVLQANRSGKFSGQRAEVENEIDNLLKDANELGIGAEAMSYLNPIRHFEMLKVDSEERREKAAPTARNLMSGLRDMLKVPSQIGAGIGARIEARRRLEGGLAELERRTEQRQIGLKGMTIEASASRVFASRASCGFDFGTPMAEAGDH